MSSTHKANKARGSRFEIDIETWLISNGLDASRLPRSGAKDIGDVHIRIKGDEFIVAECKNVKRMDLNDWISQAEIEATHHENRYGRPSHPIVIHKARNKPIDQARVTMTLGSFIDFLRQRGVL